MQVTEICQCIYQVVMMTDLLFHNIVAYVNICHRNSCAIQCILSLFFVNT